MHAPQKEGEKILQDIVKNGIDKDRIKWVKTCVDEEDSTHNHNIVNNKELSIIKYSHKSTAACCMMHLTCCEKSNHDKLDNRSKKNSKNMCALCFHKEKWCRSK